jgi:hypothetical protein
MNTEPGEANIQRQIYLMTAFKDRIRREHTTKITNITRDFNDKQLRRIKQCICVA